MQWRDEAMMDGVTPQSSKIHRKTRARVAADVHHSLDPGDHGCDSGKVLRRHGLLGELRVYDVPTCG